MFPLVLFHVFGGVRVRLYISWGGGQSYIENSSRVHLEFYSESVGQFPCTPASSTAVRVVTVEVGHTHAVLPTLEYSTPVSSPAAPGLTSPRALHS